MTSNISIIKETFDKLKTHTFDLVYHDRPNSFLCQFFVNNVLIACGDGKKKQLAKQDAADMAYSELMKCDFDFATLQGLRIKPNDYQSQLEKYAEENGMDKIVYKEVTSSQNYFYYEVKCQDKKASGMGVTMFKARTFAAYNLLQILKSTQDRMTVKTQNLKMEHDNYQKQDNSAASFFLARDLAIGYESYMFLCDFVTKIQTPYTEIIAVGGFCTQSIRATRPELDLVVYIDKENIPQFEEYLKEQTLTIQATLQKKENNMFIVIFSEKAQISKKMLIKSPELLLANLYLCSFQQQYFYKHYQYMNQYSAVFQQQLYSTYSLMLIHQWREDSNQRNLIPVDLLDYLIVQVTNEFKQLNSPYQVLSQVIYLLKNDILKEIQSYPQVELNPFLQNLPQLYQDSALALGELVDQIKQKAQEWNQQKIASWLGAFQ